MSVAFPLEREIVRFFEGMQSDYFNIFRQTATDDHFGKPSARLLRPPHSGTTGTTKGSSLWKKTLRFVLR